MIDFLSKQNKNKTFEQIAEDERSADSSFRALKVPQKNIYRAHTHTQEHALWISLSLSLSILHAYLISIFLSHSLYSLIHLLYTHSFSLSLTHSHTLLALSLSLSHSFAHAHSLFQSFNTS